MDMRLFIDENIRYDF